MTNKIAIIYHSSYGHTQKVAESIVAGANSETNIEAQMFSVDEIGDNLDQFDDHQALIFGAPTYMGDISAQLKAFFDASAGKWYAGAWRNKIGAGFTNSGSPSGDKLRSLQSIQGFAMQHGMIWVGYDEKTGVNPDNGEADQTNAHGHWLGLATMSGNDDPSVTPDENELRTARFFGRRIAKAVTRWNK